MIFALALSVGFPLYFLQASRSISAMNKQVPVSVPVLGRDVKFDEQVNSQFLGFTRVGSTSKSNLLPVPRLCMACHPELPQSLGLLLQSSSLALDTSVGSFEYFVRIQYSE